MMDSLEPNGKAQRIALAGILLVAGALRLTGLAQMEFRYDSAYWAMEALDILDGARPLVGQQVGSVNVPLPNGPLMSYLSAGVFAVAGPRPEAVAAFVALLNVVGVWLTYVMSRQLCRNRWCALIAPALMAVAPWFVLHSRMLWSLSLFPALVPLVWLALTSVLAQPTWLRGTALGLVLGLSLQLHLSMLAVGGLVLLIATVSSEHRVRTFLAISLGGVLGYGPLVIHNVLNGFQTVSTLLALPSLHAASEPKVVHAVKAFWNFSNVLSGQAMWVSKLGPPSPLPSVVDWAQGILMTAALGCASLLALKKVGARDGLSWRAKLQGPDALLLMLVCGPVLYLAMSSAQIIRHYFLVLFPMPFVMLAMAADKAAQSAAATPFKRVAPFVFGAVIALNLSTVAYLFLWLSQTGGGSAYGTVLADKAQAVAFIRADSGGAFAVDLTGAREPLPYVFLFRREQPVEVDAGPEDTKTVQSSNLGPGVNVSRYRIIEAADLSGGRQ